MVTFLLTFAIAGCSKPGVTKEGFDKIENGMTLAEVEKILGSDKKGGKVAGGIGDLAGAGSAHVWEDGDKKITVTFKDDKVTDKAQVGL